MARLRLVREQIREIEAEVGERRLDRLRKTSLMR